MPIILETDKLEIKEATKKGYDLAEGGDTVNLEQPNSKTRRGRVGHGVAQTLTTACNQAVVEPVVDMKCLRPVRTEYGKEIRKQYEAHEIDSKWSDMRKLEPRDDDLCNTLTHVQKDNYIAITEPYTEQRLEPNTQGLCNTLTSVQKDNLLCESIAGLRVRKLTPRECWRLMGFSDEVFEKAEKVNSNTQLYKQAGNSIVVNVLVEIIKKLMESVDFGMPEIKKPVKVKVRKVKR